MKVLFVTLTNIGDAVLTTPALTAILENFKDAQITLLASPRAADLFIDDPCLAKVLIYKKDASLGDKVAMIKTLRDEDFDFLADFKDTMLPFLIYARKKTPVFKKAPDYITHIKDRHLWKIRQVLPDLPRIDYKPRLWISDKVGAEASRLLTASGIKDTDKIVAVAPGARSHTKQWTKEGFLGVSKMLVDEFKLKVVLVGDRQDTKTSGFIKQAVHSGAIVDICGETTLRQLAAVLKRSCLLVTNDSAPMHIAWVVQTPVVAIFGPTDRDKYRPTGPKDAVISKKLPCSPCHLALCRTDNECMKQIQADEVFAAAKRILTI